MTSRYMCFPLAALSFVTSVASAEPPHVHGQAMLDVSVEGETLFLSLESPLDNFLGFEHAPANPNEVAKARSMAASLRLADRLFVTTAEAGCTLSKVALRSSALGADELGEAPAAKSDAPSGTGTAAGHQHADLDADFEFRCAQPTKLKGVEVRLFAAFPRLHQIQAQVVTAKRQSATKLTPTANRLVW